MSAKSLVKIEDYFYAIFATKTCRKPYFTSIALPVKSHDSIFIKRLIVNLADVDPDSLRMSRCFA